MGARGRTAGAWLRTGRSEVVAAGDPMRHPTKFLAGRVGQDSRGNREAAGHSNYGGTEHAATRFAEPETLQRRPNEGLWVHERRSGMRLRVRSRRSSLLGRPPDSERDNLLTKKKTRSRKPTTRVSRAELIKLGHCPLCPRVGDGTFDGVGLIRCDASTGELIHDAPVCPSFASGNLNTIEWRNSGVRAAHLRLALQRMLPR